MDRADCLLYSPGPLSSVDPFPRDRFLSSPHRGELVTICHLSVEIFLKRTFWMENSSSPLDGSLSTVNSPLVLTRPDALIIMSDRLRSLSLFRFTSVRPSVSRKINACHARTRMLALRGIQRFARAIKRRDSRDSRYENVMTRLRTSPVTCWNDRMPEGLLVAARVSLWRRWKRKRKERRLTTHLLMENVIRRSRSRSRRSRRSRRSDATDGFQFHRGIMEKPEFSTKLKLSSWELLTILREMLREEIHTC